MAESKAAMMVCQTVAPMAHPMVALMAGYLERSLVDSMGPMLVEPKVAYWVHPTVVT